MKNVLSLMALPFCAVGVLVSFLWTIQALGGIGRASDAADMFGAFMLFVIGSGVFAGSAWGGIKAIKNVFKNQGESK